MRRRTTQVCVSSQVGDRLCEGPYRLERLDPHRPVLVLHVRTGHVRLRSSPSLSALLGDKMSDDRTSIDPINWNQELFSGHWNGMRSAGTGRWRRRIRSCAIRFNYSWGSP